MNLRTDDDGDDDNDREHGGMWQRMTATWTTHANCIVLLTQTNEQSNLNIHHERWMDVSATCYEANELFNFHCNQFTCFHFFPSFIGRFDVICHSFVSRRLQIVGESLISGWIYLAIYCCNVFNEPRTGSALAYRIVHTENRTPFLFPEMTASHPPDKIRYYHRNWLSFRCSDGARREQNKYVILE